MFVSQYTNSQTGKITHLSCFVGFSFILLLPLMSVFSSFKFSTTFISSLRTHNPSENTHNNKNITKRKQNKTVPSAPQDIKAIPASSTKVIVSWLPPLNLNGEIVSIHFILYILCFFSSLLSFCTHFICPKLEAVTLWFNKTKFTSFFFSLLNILIVCSSNTSTRLVTHFIC